MLLCFPVPPSKRQAAGPLTENLPNVLACGPDKVGCQLSSQAVTAKQANDLPYETTGIIEFIRTGAIIFALGKWKPAPASSRWGT